VEPKTSILWEFFVSNGDTIQTKWSATFEPQMGNPKTQGETKGEPMNGSKNAPQDETKLKFL
jgi:hypothetical protein